MNHIPYIASIIAMSAGVAVAGPPSKLHHPNLQDLREQQEARETSRSNQTTKRPATIALNLDMPAAKEKGRELKRNQYHSYRPKARFFSEYERN